MTPNDFKKQIVWQYERSLKWKPGIYIAISGNTGAGKSTLLRSLILETKKYWNNVIGIDERTLHHPFLRLMFEFPDKFGFGIEMNFIVQRYLALKRWLNDGAIVLIERSHLEDKIFVDHLFENKHITKSQYSCYEQISNEIQEDLPLPDIIVCLETSFALSMERIKQSEESGERPEEFPDEERKSKYVLSWHNKYQRHFEDLRKQVSSNPKYQHTNLFFKPAETSIEKTTYDVVQLLKSMSNTKNTE